MDKKKHADSATTGFKVLKFNFNVSIRVGDTRSGAIHTLV
jgi:hypothetical protein